MNSTERGGTYEGDAATGTASVGWGLIGCGDIAGKRVAAALRDTPGSRLVAVSRRQAELAAAFARDHGAERAYPDWRELICDEQLRAVYIATPVHLHAPMAIAAAEAGKHVLCEKPMAISAVECDRMIAAARTHGVHLGVAYYRHFYPLIRRIRSLLAAGTIGEVVAARVEAFERFEPGPDHPRAWLLQPELSGGGPMFDFGCHRIEVLLDLLGPVAEVRSLLSSSRLRRGVEDTGAALFHHREGAVSSLTVTHAAAEPRDTLDLYGRDGSIHVPLLNGSELRIVDGSETRVELHPPHRNLHQPLVEQFVTAVVEGVPPEVGGEAGREVNRLLEEVYGGRTARAP